MAEEQIIRLRLDGRDFHGPTQQLTMDQNDFVTSILEDCGVNPILEEIVREAQRKKGGDKTKSIVDDKPTDERVRSLLRKIVGAGKSTDILAGFLTEQGKKWNRSEAIRNAAIFKDITDTDEQVRMRGSIVAFAFAFFLSGEASSETSPTFSSQLREGLGITSEEAATSENSRGSSAP